MAFRIFVSLEAKTEIKACSGQPDLVVGDPAHRGWLKLNDDCGPFQPRPFYDSVI